MPKKQEIMLMRSQILTPKTNYQGGETKWFDDSKLLKNNRK